MSSSMGQKAAIKIEDAQEMTKVMNSLRKWVVL
jgi:hypothetical protein